MNEKKLCTVYIDEAGDLGQCRILGMVVKLIRDM